MALFDYAEIMFKVYAAMLLSAIIVGLIGVAIVALFSSRN